MAGLTHTTVVGAVGLEPTTSRLSSVTDYKTAALPLSYAPSAVLAEGYSEGAVDNADGHQTSLVAVGVVSKLAINAP